MQSSEKFLLYSYKYDILYLHTWKSEVSVTVSLLVFLVVVLRSPERSVIKASSYIPRSCQILNMRSILCFTFSSLKTSRNIFCCNKVKLMGNLVGTVKAWRMLTNWIVSILPCLCKPLTSALCYEYDQKVKFIYIPLMHYSFWLNKMAS